MPTSDKITQTDTGLWKDYFNRARVERLSKAFKKEYPEFKAPSFVTAVLSNEFTQLELKARIRRIAEELGNFLPADYDQACEIVMQVAPTVPEFENWALTTYVELYGLDHFDTSVRALEELTQHGTSEFAIRPYMIRYTDRMMPILHRWARHDNEHVRRLAAEGSRPRGVWVAHIEQFKKDPRPVIKLLDKLKADPSLYVRKAVANNLNDISKEHPDVVIKTAKRWQKNQHPHTDWIIKRACRSLIKLGDPRVLELLGFTSKPRLDVIEFNLSKRKLQIGSTASIEVILKSRSKSDQKLAIDYRVHYAKANGKTSSKVFKLVEKILSAGDKLSLATRHSFKQMSTRKHFPGKHRVDLIINGIDRGSIEFSLIK
jgi:3-methyladenine DNA glycosylase AlkC